MRKVPGLVVSGHVAAELTVQTVRDRVDCSTCAPLGEVFGYPYRRTTCCFLYDLAQDVPDSFGADSSDGFADSDRLGNPDSIASGAARSGGRRPLTHGERVRNLAYSLLQDPFAQGLVSNTVEGV